MSNEKIHIAGRVDENRKQHCARCGSVILDNSDKTWGSFGENLSFFQNGAPIFSHRRGAHVATEKEAQTVRPCGRHVVKSRNARTI